MSLSHRVPPRATHAEILSPSWWRTQLAATLPPLFGPRSASSREGFQCDNHLRIANCLEVRETEGASGFLPAWCRVFRDALGYQRCLRPAFVLVESPSSSGPGRHHTHGVNTRFESRRGRHLKVSHRRIQRLCTDLVLLAGRQYPGSILAPSFTDGENAQTSPSKRGWISGSGCPVASRVAPLLSCLPLRGSSGVARSKERMASSRGHRGRSACDRVLGSPDLSCFSSIGPHPAHFLALRLAEVADDKRTSGDKLRIGENPVCRSPKSHKQRIISAGSTMGRRSALHQKASCDLRVIGITAFIVPQSHAEPECDGQTPIDIRA